MKTFIAFLIITFKGLQPLAIGFHLTTKDPRGPYENLMEDRLVNKNVDRKKISTLKFPENFLFIFQIYIILILRGLK